MSANNSSNVSANSSCDSYDNFQAQCAAVSKMEAATYEDHDQLRSVHALIDGVCALPCRLPWGWCGTGFNVDDTVLGKLNTITLLSSYVNSFLSGSRAHTYLRGFFACAKTQSENLPIVKIDGYSLTFGKYSVPLIGSIVDEANLFGEVCDVTYYNPFRICGFARNVLSPDITCRAIIDIDHIARITKGKYYYSTDPVVKKRPYYLSDSLHAILHRPEDYVNLPATVHYAWCLNRRSTEGRYMVGVCGVWGYIVLFGNHQHNLNTPVTMSDRRHAVGDLVYSAAVLQFGHLPVSDFFLGVHASVECEKSRFKGLCSYGQNVPYGAGESRLPNVCSRVKRGPATWIDMPVFSENGTIGRLSGSEYKIRVVPAVLSDFAPFGHPQHIYLRQRSFEDNTFDAVICAYNDTDYICTGVDTLDSSTFTKKRYPPQVKYPDWDAAKKWLTTSKGGKSILFMTAVPMVWRLRHHNGGSRDVPDSTIEWTLWQMDYPEGFLIFSGSTPGDRYVLRVNRNHEGRCTAMSSVCTKITSLPGLDILMPPDCRLLSRLPNSTVMSVPSVYPPASGNGVVRPGSSANFRTYETGDYAPSYRSVTN